MLSNYHSHTDYCDGGASMEDFVQRAADLSLVSFGVSSHAPLPFSCKWAMLADRVKDYMRRIDFLKQQWGDRMELYAGLEVDYIPHYAGPKSAFIQSLGLDYTIGSIHFVDFIEKDTPWEVDGANSTFRKGLEICFQGDIQKAVERYYQLTQEMVLHSTPTIVGHLDKIKIQNHFETYFTEQENWYTKAIIETLKAIQSKKVLVEVNTRGYYKKKAEIYPSPSILHRMNNMGIPVTINSDCHLPHEMDLGFDYALKTLYDIGYREVYCLLNNQWRSVAIRKDGIVRNRGIAV